MESAWRIQPSNSADGFVSLRPQARSDNVTTTQTTEAASREKRNADVGNAIPDQDKLPKTENVSSLKGGGQPASVASARTFGCARCVALVLRSANVYLINRLLQRLHLPSSL